MISISHPTKHHTHTHTLVPYCQRLAGNVTKNQLTKGSPTRNARKGRTAGVSKKACVRIRWNCRVHNLCSHTEMLLVGSFSC